MVGVPSGCALLGRFAISARVSLRCSDDIVLRLQNDLICMEWDVKPQLNNQHGTECQMPVSACTRSKTGY